MTQANFTALELRRIRAFKTPYGIQKYLDEIPYHLANTAWSPRRVLREGTAHCLEGAIFAAAALRVLGHPPLIVDFEAHRDSDHVLAVFRQDGHWGALASSNYSGCRYREPVYRTLRELAMSYFDTYFNLARERSLRRYSRPVNLGRFDTYDWVTTENDLWLIAEHLCEIPHCNLLTRAQEKRLNRIDVRNFEAGLVRHRSK
ncbi:MAG: hypothetical protein A2X86_10420 [Bdellovibrionales bacterium GWA2_49_15]|nr:MAG: hypothetical protein A2X86_10420 [Bdellovibrionales bacterium GWA2_49_15]HAZ14743.1 hypothetical protein [Bdellovibrionales bacterium]